MKSEHKNNIDFLISTHLENLQSACRVIGGLYVARIDMNFGQGPISLEVEVGVGEIGFSYEVPVEDHHDLYEYLIDSLEEKGVVVFRRYQEFEKALEASSDE